MTNPPNQSMARRVRLTLLVSTEGEAIRKAMSCITLYFSELFPLLKKNFKKVLGPSNYQAENPTSAYLLA